jgi:hypothetical protein
MATGRAGKARFFGQIGWAGWERFSAGFQFGGAAKHIF